ncbi:Sec-independent protein translocase protein TatA [Deinococcus aetherius]|uniref:Sec-independent protein translocase protein TatA n=1 Tax=Deinococcus aetherius TaxID=200252 RepID=A0ABM8AAY8_9DEIO|nr:twin-arginine translocase TatA/TatE family subunit [Deinococcus aetherius]BDP40849.1 Sec-independent protein translocase protein TatA [Deinococcus aetherius]
MPNIGAPELLIILVVALIVFGPRKLPELGKSIGQGLREFRKSTGAVTDELRRGLDTTPDVPAPAPTLPAASAEVRNPVTVDAAVPVSGPTPRS